MPSKSKSARVIRAAIATEALERRTFFAVGVPVTVAVNTQQTFQTIEGFGAGMQSWAHLPEYYDPNFFDTIVNDLGSTMVRAPILPLAEKKNDDADPNHFNWAAFDSSALAAPFDFLQQMKARGVTEFLGSVWTAPAWMKSNNLHTDGGSLRPDMYSEYAEYLSAVTQIAKNDYGIDLSAISVQNEPYFVEPYESTTYTTNQLREDVRAIGRKFAHDGIGTKIVLPEDLIFEDRNKWYVSRVMEDPETKNYVGAFAGHGLTAHWPEIRDTLAPYNKEFWMTETSGTSGLTWEGAMGLANSVMNAIGTANASTYLYWQFSGAQADASRVLMVNGVPTPKYYAAKQFYRWIRPGMVHVGTTSSLDDQIRVASFKDPKTGAMTTVILNRDGDTHDVTFNLSGSGLPGTYRVYRSSGTEQTVSLGTITGGSNFTINAPGLSVITITNVPDPVPVHPGTAIPKTVIFQGASNFTAGKNFFIASLKGYNDSLTAQINGGADVNQVLQGWTPIMLAAESGNPGSPVTFQTLLDHGANFNATNPEGMTPLHLAAANSFTKFGSALTMQADKITKLISLGANPNARDANGRTPLIWAGMMGAYVNFTQDPSIIKALLAGGADPFLKDNAGKTALDWANAGGYDRLADVLIAAMGLDHTKPTGDIVDVAPDPRDTSVTDFFFNFSERVQGFDITDITLSRNGVPFPWPTDPAANGYILTDLDDTDRHYQLSGVGGLTAAPGNYVISISATGSGITDTSLNPLAANISDSWTNGDVSPPPSEQKPFKGTPFAINKNGATQIEFEDFDTGGETVAYHDLDSKNLGGSYRPSEGVDIQPSTDAGGGFNVGYTKAGEWLEYTINVATAGNYDFGFRLASTGSNGKFHAEIDGANVTGALTVPNSGGYQTWQTLTKSAVQLTAGQHVLRVAMDGVSTNGSVGNFNWLQIAPTQSTPQQAPFSGVPFAVGSTPATIQAEDFDNGGEGIAYHDTDAINNGGSAYRASTGPGVDVELTGDAGGGNDVGFTKAGEWLEYTINVAQAGTYSFDFRVASKGLGGKFRALIDGADKTGQVQVADTTAWNTFVTFIRSGVALPAGQHVLRLSFDTVGAGTGFTGNFNWIKITQTSANPGGSTTISNSTAAYVRGGTFATQNFGADPTLVVKKHADPASSREAFLTFDLSSVVSTISSAKLRLFGGLNDTSSASVQSQVFAGSTTSWDENTLTWNNSRAIATGSALATVTVTGTTPQWYEFDVTSFLKSEKALGHNTVTLALKNPTQQNALVVFNSDDAGSNRPEIAIT